jgi:hypothetical protein
VAEPGRPGWEGVGHPPDASSGAPGVRAQRSRRRGRSSGAGLRGHGRRGMARAGRPPDDPSRTFLSVPSGPSRVWVQLRTCLAACSS